MKRKMFLVFSHKLTNEQIEDAQNNWHIDNFVYMPNDLQKVWSNINPKWDSKELLSYVIFPIFRWIKKEAEEGIDVVLIQGDVGTSCILAQLVHRSNLTPVYATTEREVVEVTAEDGSVIKRSIFKHVQFRKYTILGKEG